MYSAQIRGNEFFGKVGQKSRSYGHIMYTVIMYLNSVLWDPVHFILCGNIWAHP